MIARISEAVKMLETFDSGGSTLYLGGRDTRPGQDPPHRAGLGSSSGKRQRLGKLSKEGNALLRYLWTEAAIQAARKTLS